MLINIIIHLYLFLICLYFYKESALMGTCPFHCPAWLINIVEQKTPTTKQSNNTIILQKKMKFKKLISSDNIVSGASVQVI